MKVYLHFINKKDGTTRDRKDITNHFERWKPSENKEDNNIFLDCWLADRTNALKKLYFPRKQGLLMLWAVNDEGTAIGFSKWHIGSVAVEE